MREQFVALCVRKKEDIQALEGWSASLKGLRWEAIVQFCGEDTNSKFGWIFIFSISTSSFFSKYKCSCTVCCHSPQPFLVYGRATSITAHSS